MWQLLELTQNQRGYLKKKETHHSLVKEEKRKDNFRPRDRECGRVFKPHPRFLRFIGRLAKIFDLNLRIDFLLEYQPRLRYQVKIRGDGDFDCLVSGQDKGRGGRLSRV